MYDTGCLASDLGDLNVARFWWEAAANSGHGPSAQNMAVAEIQAGRPSAARPWLLRSVELGNPDGFAALTQMARDAGDGAGKCDGRGAGRKPGIRSACSDSVCSPSSSAATIRRRCAGRAVSRKGRRTGDPDAMFLAGIGHHGVGDHYEARHWLLRAEESRESACPGGTERVRAVARPIANGSVGHQPLGGCLGFLGTLQGCGQLDSGIGQRLDALRVELLPLLVRPASRVRLGANEPSPVQFRPCAESP